MLLSGSPGPGSTRFINVFVHVGTVSVFGVSNTITIAGVALVPDTPPPTSTMVLQFAAIHSSRPPAQTPKQTGVS